MPASPACAELRSIAHGNLVVDCDFEATGPAVLKLIAWMGLQARDVDCLAVRIGVAGFTAIRPEQGWIWSSRASMTALTLRDLAGDGLAAVPVHACLIGPVEHASDPRDKRRLATPRPAHLDGLLALARDGKAPPLSTVVDPSVSDDSRLNCQSRLLKDLQ